MTGLGSRFGAGAPHRLQSDGHCGGGGHLPGPFAVGRRGRRPGRKPGRKRGSTMTAAQRAAVSARMKKYWAGRRAGKAAKSAATGGAKKRTMSPAARRKIAAAQDCTWSASEEAGFLEVQNGEGRSGDGTFTMQLACPTCRLDRSNWLGRLRFLVDDPDDRSEQWVDSPQRGIDARNCHDTD
jgi:hypothetical protein